MRNINLKELRNYKRRFFLCPPQIDENTTNISKLLFFTIHLQFITSNQISTCRKLNLPLKQYLFRRLTHPPPMRDVIIELFHQTIDWNVWGVVQQELANLYQFLLWRKKIDISWIRFWPYSFELWNLQNSNVTQFHGSIVLQHWQ